VAPDRSGKAGSETCFLYAGGRTPAGYFSFAYSALACFRMGMSGSVEGRGESRKLQIKGVNFLVADVAQHQRGIIWG
jgi:hypothetical protein